MALNGLGNTYEKKYIHRNWNQSAKLFRKENFIHTHI